jgi:hypothetical protein
VKDCEDEQHSRLDMLPGDEIVCTCCKYIHKGKMQLGNELYQFATESFLIYFHTRREVIPGWEHNVN